MIKIETRGFPEALQALIAVDAKGQIVELVRDVVSRLTRYVVSINPVDTGAMRDSWTWVAIGPLAKMYISLSAYNPRSKLQVIEYAGYVDERVGLMDAVMEQGERIAVESAEAMVWEPR